MAAPEIRINSLNYRWDHRSPISAIRSWVHGVSWVRIACAKVSAYALLMSALADFAKLSSIPKDCAGEESSMVCLRKANLSQYSWSRPANAFAILAFIPHLCKPWWRQKQLSDLLSMCSGPIRSVRKKETDISFDHLSYPGYNHVAT